MRTWCRRAELLCMTHLLRICEDQCHIHKSPILDFFSFHALRYIKTLVTPISAQFYSLCILLLYVQANRKNGVAYWQRRPLLKFCVQTYIEISSLLGCYAAVLLVSYWRFETTYWSHFQGSSRTMVVRITIIRCVNSQKIADHFIVDYTPPAKRVLFQMENQNCSK